MTNENQTEISLIELEQILLDSEETIGTMCRYGEEFSFHEKGSEPGSTYVSLRHSWDGGYVLQGHIKGKGFGDYDGNKYDAQLKDVFEKIKKDYHTKRKEKKKKEEAKLERMIEEDSKKHLKKEIIMPIDINQFEVFVGEIKNIHFNQAYLLGKVGFGIRGDVELTKHNRVNGEVLKFKIKTWWPLSIEIEKVPSTTNKEVWKINETNCSLYENRSAVAGSLWNGYPIEINLGEDPCFYVSKIIEKGKKNNIDITEKFIHEFFTPMFKELNFGYLCERYNGNKK